MTHRSVGTVLSRSMEATVDDRLRDRAWRSTGLAHRGHRRDACIVQKWLGHAQFTTTAIYANALAFYELISSIS